jgi:hypothetical protein
MVCDISLPENKLHLFNQHYTAGIAALPRIIASGSRCFYIRGGVCIYFSLDIQQKTPE